MEITISTKNGTVFVTKDIFATPVEWTELQGKDRKNVLGMFQWLREHKEPIEFIPPSQVI